MSIVETWEEPALDTVTLVEDSVLTVTKSLVERAEPVTKPLPQRPRRLPSMVTGVDWMFIFPEIQLRFADKFVANQKKFFMKLAHPTKSAPMAKTVANSVTKSGARGTAAKTPASQPAPAAFATRGNMCRPAREPLTVVAISPQSWRPDGR